MPPFAVLGIEDRFGMLRGAAVFNDFADRNIELTCVGKGAFTRDVCRELAQVAFEVNGCERITIRTRKGNVAWSGWRCAGAGRSKGSCVAGTTMTTRW